MSFISTYVCTECGQHLMFEQTPCGCPTRQPKKAEGLKSLDKLLEYVAIPPKPHALTEVKDFVRDMEASVSISSLNKLCDYIHELNSRWWTNPSTGEPIDRNKGEMLMLMVSELSEAMEGIRKNIQDTHLPNRKMEEVEMSDLLIRLLDYCGGWNLDLSGATMEKLRYNKTRKDHTYEARLEKGGKKF